MNDEKVLRLIANRILDRTSAWNGWFFEEEQRLEMCLKLAKSVMKTIERASMKDKKKP